MKVIKDYLVNTNYALTTFDKQLYKEQIEKLEKLLYQLKNMIQPRQKFKFSRREAKDSLKAKSAESSQKNEK